MQTTTDLTTTPNAPMSPTDEWTTEALIGFVRGEKTAVDDAVAKISEVMRNTAARAWRIGMALAILKDRAGHGNWREWLSQNLPEIGVVTATTYIRLYTHWSDAQSVENLSVAKAIRMIQVAADDPTLARRAADGRLASVRLPGAAKTRPASSGTDDPAASVAVDDAIQAICLRLSLDDIGTAIARRIMCGQGDSEIAKELTARAREVTLIHERIRAVAEELHLAG